MSFLKSVPSNLSISKISRKKMPNFWNKISLFYVFLCYNFKKLFSYLKSAPSNSFICKILRKKKCLNLRKFGNKRALFGYFCARVLKNYSRIWNQHPQIYLFPKFPEKKMSKFGNKSALFGYFCARTLRNYCRIWNQNPQICLFAKLLQKIIIPKFGNKSSLFGYFWARIFKKLISYLKSAPSNLSLSKISWKKNA